MTEEQARAVVVLLGGSASGTVVAVKEVRDDSESWVVADGETDRYIRTVEEAITILYDELF